MEQVQPAAELNENIEALVEHQADLAERMLQLNGYGILAELNSMLRSMILMTALFTAPIKINQADVETQLGENKEKFFKEFDELTQEIQAVIKAFAACASLHQGKEGEVAAEELEAVSKAATGYSDLQTTFEESIMPKIGKLTEDLVTYGVDVDALLQFPDDAQVEEEPNVQ